MYFCLENKLLFSCFYQNVSLLKIQMFIKKCIITDITAYKEPCFN